VTAARLGVVILLLAGAFFVLAPWLSCALVVPIWRFNAFTISACTFGDPALASGYGVPGFAGPYWGRLLVGIVYLVAAVLVIQRRRPL
jgi:hypothetical protein